VPEAALALVNEPAAHIDPLDLGSCDARANSRIGALLKLCGHVLRHTGIWSEGYAGDWPHRHRSVNIRLTRWFGPAVVN